MTKKRRNGGKNRCGRGHVGPVHCSNCYRFVPKDKAVSRFLVRNMIESAAQRDMKEASVYDVYVVPKMYVKTQYCISCAVHAHVVRARPRELRRVREPPRRLKRDERRPDVGKPMRGLKRSKRRPPKAAEGDNDDAPRRPRREERENREAPQA